MRRWAIGALSGMAVLVMAVPAQAKGEASDVTITNSGGALPPPGSGGASGAGSGSDGSEGSGAGIAVLAAPIHLTRLDAARWLAATGIFQAPQSHPAATALGPGLDVQMAYLCGENGGTIRQTLYPYARGGPIAHTPAGQSFCDGPLLATWWHVAPDTMSILQAKGLPATMPVAEVRPDEGAAAAAANSESGTGAAGSSVGSQAGAAGTSSSGSANGVPVMPIALGVSAVAAVLALAAVMRRRRTVAA